MGLPDTAAGRRRYFEWIEGLVDEKNPEHSGSADPEGQSLNSTLRRGWYFGSEAFQERLVTKLERLKPAPRPELGRKGYSAEQSRDHGMRDAERVIAAAQKIFGLKAASWKGLPKGDWRKGLVAGLVRSRSLVPNGWVANRLFMGATGAVSRTIRSAQELATGDRKVRRLLAQLEQISISSGPFYHA
jgi:putative transposase